MSIRRDDGVVLKTAVGEVMVKELKWRTAKFEAALHRPAHVECTLQTREVFWIARIVWASQ